MKRFAETWARFNIRHRIPVLIITLIAICSAPLSFNALYHDNSNESYFLENDPNLISFNRLLDEFGDNEYLLVGIPARPGDEDVFHPNTIKMIHEITEYLENHRFVTQVRSLSKYEYTHDDEGMLATDDVFDTPQDLLSNRQQQTQARTIMKKEDLALGSLITRDFQHTQISARTEYRRGENDHKVAVVQELRDFILKQDYAAQGYSLHFSGSPVISERFQTITQTDSAVLNPLLGLVMVIVLLAIFKSVTATLIPLLLIGLTVFLTIGLQGLMGWPFTAVNTALVPTIVILSVSTAVHVLIVFYRARRRDQPSQAAASTATQVLFWPILFTCITTAIGFFTLSVTDLAPVQEFALLAAASALILFVLSVSTLPAILSFVPWLPRNRFPISIKEQSHQQSKLIQLGQSILRRRIFISACGILITAFSLFGITQIHVDTNLSHYFKKNSWINIDLEYFNQHFKGYSNLEIIVDSGEPDGVKDPQFLNRVEALQSHVEAQPETGKAISLVRFYKQINMALNNDDTAFYKLPDSAQLTAQFLFLYDNTGPEEDLSDLKNFDGQLLRISIPVINLNATEMTSFLERIRQHINSEFQDLNIELTGGIVMQNAQNNYVNQGMLKSFGIAIIAIGCCFLLLFRSFKYGLIALTPSIVPILLTGGIVSLAGIPMNLGTMIVGAMTIGIAVDDSIHLMSRYLQLKALRKTTEEAIAGALDSAGRAIILTSIVLVSGFSVMLLGNFVSYIYVGLFSAMIMVFALIGDLIFMPALLYIFDKQPSTTPVNQNSTKPINLIKEQTPYV